MRIGFIGAGKMGFTLGKHLKLHECTLCEDGKELYRVNGYYSRNPDNAKKAAEFTDTNYYESMRELMSNSDILILTVPDGEIYGVYRELCEFKENIKGKIIIHTSGALSSEVFSGTHGIYPYSVHPIYAVSSKTESYKNFNECFITIEGHEKYIHFLEHIFTAIGHRVMLISSDNKVKYHAGAVFASNLVIAVYEMGVELLTQCGFTADEAGEALKPLFINNAKRLEATTPEKALSGPVERCDIETVKKHLEALDGEYREAYRILSLKLTELVEKTKTGDYEKMRKSLEK